VENRATPVNAYSFNPLADSRWPDFLRRRSAASVFHSPAWLEALQRTYRYEPVVYTTNPPDTELANGWVFCRIDSWLTGRRLVSLPFSDHCDSLVDNPHHSDYLAQELLQEQIQQKWKYVEFRPRSTEPAVPKKFQVSQAFCLHRLDLQPTISQLFNNLHRDSTQRKIRRSEREGLTYEEGGSQTLLSQFYRLLLLTRRRHQVPPQPRAWFSNLVACFGDHLKIRVASKQGQPLAGILTLRFQDTLVYKYGGSDLRYQNLGGMHLCLWRAIEEAKNAGLREFDFGRSDADDPGLIVFKDRWGTRRSMLTYYRRWAHAPHAEAASWPTPRTKKILAHTPDALLAIGGRLLYRHLG
jgi:hypothetical protein